MRFRTKHIADSVTERITAIADHIRTGAPLPQSKGAATVHLERGDNGELVVTKTFEHGEPELMTISGQEPESGLPAGFTDITPEQPQSELSAVGVDAPGLAESAAMGGDSLDTLLRG